MLNRYTSPGQFPDPTFWPNLPVLRVDAPAFCWRPLNDIKNLPPTVRLELMRDFCSGPARWDLPEAMLPSGF